MSDLETLKAQHPEWKKWPHKCFEFCVALQELVQQHEAELAKAQETIQQQARELKEAVEALVWCGGSFDFSPGGQARLGWEKGPMKIISAYYSRHSARAQHAEAKKGE